AGRPRQPAGGLTMRILRILILSMLFLATSCSTDSLKHLSDLAKNATKAHGTAKAPDAPAPRLVMFVGVDISGSFMNGRYFDDSIAFLAPYIHRHLNGLGGMEVPHSLFLGSIGGAAQGEAETPFPVQGVQDPPIGEIEQAL